MEERSGTLTTNVVGIEGRRVRRAEVVWQDGRIGAVTDLGPEEAGLGYLIPGFVDAHVHIETTMLTPAEFARVVVRHGTVACVSDPHEMGNVLGIEGVRWMLADAARTPLTVLFGAPSCVPATAFETSGARLEASEIEELLDLPGVGYLSEVMDYPGVLARDESMMAKIAATLDRGRPVDGHAPRLAGDDLRRYVSAGITTDHECSTLSEAEEKIGLGMRILIREGSAARNFEALHPLISAHPGRTMLCTDDVNPADLSRGQIDRLVARAVAHGHDVFTVLEAACLTPREHYGLDLGRLRPGDPFTAVLLDDLVDFRPRRTWLSGSLVARDGTTLLPRCPVEPVNNFGARPVSATDLTIRAPNAVGSVTCRVMTATDGQLLTGVDRVDLPVKDGVVLPDPAADVLLTAVVNRYRPAPPAVAFMRGFGLHGGAIASSVAHDSHNIIAVGTDAGSVARAVNAVIAQRGGLALAYDLGEEVLPLPVAGLMSDAPAEEVARRFGALEDHVRTRLGSPLRAPYMTLSFMSLLVIGSLKLGDLGLFDVDRFEFTPVVLPV